jgi:histone deacetylase 1/2
VHGCKSSPTRISTTDPFSLTDGDSLNVDDSTRYRNIIGALQYLTLSRSDISFSVSEVCQYLHALTLVHRTTVKRVLCYLKDTLKVGISFRSAPSILLTAFSDADLDGCLDDRRSAGRGC